MSCAKDIKKKRTKNTLNTQYEIYLNYMEADYCFRSGTINPTLEENYLNNKWKELTNKLNACGDGPALTTEECIEDWIYSVKAKYRKLQVHRLQTGSGPPSDIKISDLEDRGLSVCGKSTVTGAPSVTTYEGVAIAEETTGANKGNISNESSTNNFKISEEPYSCVSLDIIDIYDGDIVNNDDIPVSSLNNNNLETKTNTEPLPDSQKIYKNKKRQTYNKSKIRPTPLSVLDTDLSHNSNETQSIDTTFNEILQTFSDKYISTEKENLILEKGKLQLKQKKLEFEIAKYKYENKDFHFNN